MAVIGGKHSSIGFYYDEADLLGEGICLALAEKEIDRNIVAIKHGHLPSNIPENVLTLHPFQELPLMEDRDLAIIDHFIIMEYLDERFPHPPLLPVYPIVRAEYRTCMYTIKRSWYDGCVKDIMACEVDCTDPEKISLAKAKRKILADSLVRDLDDLVGSYPYALGDHFSLLDCVVSPVIFNLNTQLGIPESSLPKPTMKLIEKYKKTILSKASARAVFNDK